MSWNVKRFKRCYGSQRANLSLTVIKLVTVGHRSTEAFSLSLLLAQPRFESGRPDEQSFIGSPRNSISVRTQCLRFFEKNCFFTVFQCLSDTNCFSCRISAFSFFMSTKDFQFFLLYAESGVIRNTQGRTATRDLTGSL